MPKVSAIVVALDPKKPKAKTLDKAPFLRMDDRPVFMRSIELFASRDDVTQIVLVVDPTDAETIKDRYGAHLGFGGVKLAQGGPDRVSAVAAALEKLDKDVDLVAIQNALRPAITAEQIDQLFEVAQKNGSAVLAVPAAGNLKEVDKDLKVAASMSTQNVYITQTPQVFKRQIIVDAYARRGQLKGDHLDDAELVEAAGAQVQLIEGSPLNVLIRGTADIKLAKAALNALPKPKKKPLSFHEEEQMW